MIIQIAFSPMTGELYGLNESGVLVKWNPNIRQWEAQHEA